MLGAYFGQLDQNVPAKGGGNRSHVGPVLVGMVLVGGVATYAYKHASPELPSAARPSASTIPAVSAGFDLSRASSETADGSVYAPPLIDAPPGDHAVRPAILATIPTATSALRAHHRRAYSSASPNRYDFTNPQPFSGAGSVGPAHADVLELGPSYEPESENASPVSPSLAYDPSLPQNPLGGNGELQANLDQPENNVITTINQSSTTTAAAAKAVDNAGLSALNNSDSTSTTLEGAQVAYASEAETEVDDALPPGQGEIIAAVNVPEGVAGEPDSMSEPAAVIGQVSGQEAFVSTRITTAQAPPAPLAQAATGFTQFYIPTFSNGREIGSIPLRISADKDVAIHLGSFLSLFHDSMDAELFERLSHSPNAQEYVSLASMKAAGFSLHYDIINKRLVLGLD